MFMHNNHVRNSQSNKMFESTDDNCLAALGNAAGPTFTCSLVQCINAGWSHCFRRQLLTCSAFTVVCRKWVFMGKISQHDGQRGNASNGRNNRKLDSIKLSVWWPHTHEEVREDK